MIFYIFDILFTTYTFMMLVRVFGSWFPRFSQSRFMRFIAYYVDPYLNFFRRFVPSIGMIDISPMFAFISLKLIQWVTLSLLR